MIDTSAASIADEIQRAETYAEVRRKPIRKIIDRFVGRWHDNPDRCTPTPENTVAAWCKWALAQIAFSSPMPQVRAHWGEGVVPGPMGLPQMMPPMGGTYAMGTDGAMQGPPGMAPGMGGGFAPTGMPPQQASPPAFGNSVNPTGQPGMPAPQMGMPPAPAAPGMPPAPGRMGPMMPPPPPPLTYRSIARYMEKCLGKWAKVSTLAVDMDLVCRDALFAFGVFKIGMEPVDPTGNPADRANQGQGSLRPFAVHKPIWDFGMVGPAEHWTKCRILYDAYWRDLDDVRATYGADPEIATKLINSYDASGIGPSVRPGGDPPTADRKQVRLIDVYIPELRMVGTLCSSGPQASAVENWWLKPLTPWYGPPLGPYVVVGFGSVPNDPYPISPIQAVFEELLQMWVNQESAAKEVDSAKRGIIIGGDGANLEEQIHKMPSGGIIKEPALGKEVTVQNFEIGGTHSERYAHIDRLRESVETKLGFGEAQQGIANAKTATSNNIAQGNSDINIEDLRGRFTEAMRQVITGVGWYMFYDPNYSDRVATEQSVPDPLTGQFKVEKQYAEFRGGVDEVWIDGAFWPSQDLSWEADFDVSIAPNSMVHQSNQAAQQDVLALMNLVQPLYALHQLPGINVRAITDMVGEAFNQRELYDQWFSPGLAAMAQQPPAEPGQAPGASVGAGAMAAAQAHGAGMGSGFGGGGGFGTPPAPAPTPFASTGGGMGGPSSGTPAGGGTSGSRPAFAMG